MTTQSFESRLLNNLDTISRKSPPLSISNRFQSIGFSDISSKEGEEFIALPYRLFGSDPYWIPQPRSMVMQNLNRKKNPFYKNHELKLWIVRDLKTGQTVGRIAGISKKTYPQQVHFGFYDSTNQVEVSRILFNSVKEWALSRNASKLDGPYSPSTNHECGLLIDGFDDSPTVMMPYNPEYYHPLFQDFGFQKAKDLFAYSLFSNDDFAPQMDQKAAVTALDPRIEIRSIQMKKFDSEIKDLLTVYNQAWEKNWGFLPLSEKEFFEMAKEMKPLIDPELILIARVEGKPAGFSLVLPDIHQAFATHRSGKENILGYLKWWWHGMGPGRRKTINRVRILTLGVTSQYRPLGIGPIMYKRIKDYAAKKGYISGEASWILEDNIAMNRALQRMNAKRTKTYRLFTLILQNLP